jgi:hypothetical protein
VKLNIANSTHKSIKILGKKSLSESPRIIKAIKQKGSFKALMYNDGTDEMEIYSQDLTSREQAVGLNLGAEQLLGVQ